MQSLEKLRLKVLKIQMDGVFVGPVGLEPTTYRL
jgi:hypothetical protein